jgi:hypothetical protein
MESYDAVPGVLNVISCALLTNRRDAFAHPDFASPRLASRMDTVAALGWRHSRHSSLSSATMPPAPLTSPAAKVRIGWPSASTVTMQCLSLPKAPSANRTQSREIGGDRQWNSTRRCNFLWASFWGKLRRSSGNMARPNRTAGSNPSRSASKSLSFLTFPDQAEESREMRRNVRALGRGANCEAKERRHGSPLAAPF